MCKLHQWIIAFERDFFVVTINAATWDYLEEAAASTSDIALKLSLIIGIVHDQTQSKAQSFLVHGTSSDLHRRIPKGAGYNQTRKLGMEPNKDALANFVRVRAW